MGKVDTEDRALWYAYSAEVTEPNFVEHLKTRYGIQAAINPAKERNPKAFDLVLTPTNDVQVISELKPMQNPFFMAGKLYGVDPQYAFSFNVSDYLEYREADPGVIMFFWLNWQTLDRLGVRVEPMNKVWWCYLGEFVEFIQYTNPPIHEYKRRKTDPRPNAKSSYIFDVRNAGRLVV